MASPAPSFIEWGAQSFITTFANKNLTTNPLAGSDGQDVQRLTISMDRWIIWPEPRP